MSWNTFEETLETDYWIPVIVFIGGCAVESISWSIEKQSHINTKQENRSYLTDPMWWCGLGTRGLSGFVYFVSLGFAPASLLQPLKSTIIALNVISARVFFKEPLNWVHIVSVLLIIIGVTLTVIYGPKPPAQSFNAVDIIELYERDLWVILISIVSGVVAVLLFFSIVFEFKWDMDSETYDHWITKCCIVIRKRHLKHKPATKYKKDTDLKLIAMNDVKREYNSNFKKYITITDNRIDRFLIFSLPFIAAYFGSWCQLFSKTIMELVANSFKSKENAKLNLTHYITYVIFVSWGTCAVLTEKYKQRGLRHYGMMYIASIFQVLNMVGAAVFGGVFFEEFDTSTSSEKILYTCSIIISFIGVGVLTFKSKGDVHDETQSNETQSNASTKDIETEPIITKNDAEQQNLVSKTTINASNGEHTTQNDH